MKITGNEPAFSGVEHDHDHGVPYIRTIPGLTIRQYYAGLAMQSVLNAHGEDFESFIARRAVKYADALIEELNKTEK